MSFFGRPNFRDLKSEQSTATPPVANTAPLIRPEEAPSTVAGNFPADFKDYHFVDSRIATFKSKDPLTGNTTRRRGIIAHMAAESGDPDGAHSKIDSFYTAQDLVRGGHPDAGKIITLLNVQTDNCMVAETGQAPGQTQAAETAKPVVVASSSGKASAKPMTHTAVFTQVSA